MFFNFGFYAAAKTYPHTTNQQMDQQVESADMGADEDMPELLSETGEWNEFNQALEKIREINPPPTEPKVAKTVPRILIADMAVSDVGIFKRDKSVQILIPDSSNGAADLGKNCGANLKKIEDFFSALLASRAPPFELDEPTVRNLEQSLWKTHGYHVLGLVQAGLRKSQVIMLPMHPPPSVLDGISDHKKYIASVVLPEMVSLYRMVREQLPDLVLVATSDTFEENERDLRTGGYQPNDAKIAAEEIMGALIGAWTTLISDFPQVRFVVPVGNGGADSIGDRLESRMLRHGPIPAVLPFANLLRVASFEKRKDSCLSAFSNFGVEGSDVAAKGREVESWAPCGEHPSVRLSGTSQASAKVTNYLASSLENGISIEDALKSFQKESCLEDRVSLAARMPEP